MSKLHYDTFLGDLYEWMIGGLEAALDHGRRDLRAHAIAEAPPNGRAVDLGAGLGSHAQLLAELGWQVTAIDTSELLLGERTTAHRGVSRHRSTRWVDPDLRRSSGVARTRTRAANRTGRAR